MGEDIAGKPLDALARGNDDPFRANEPDGPRDRVRERPEGITEERTGLGPSASPASGRPWKRSAGSRIRRIGKT